jgi:hypothetical protein
LLAAHKSFPNWFLEGGARKDLVPRRVMFRASWRVGHLRGANHPESLHPDSSVFDRFRLSERLVHGRLCKIFSPRRCAIVNTVNLNWGAQNTRKPLPKMRCLTASTRQNPLFHRMFLNFCHMRESLRRQSIARVSNSVSIVQLRCVASHGV